MISKYPEFLAGPFPHLTKKFYPHNGFRWVAYLHVGNKAIVEKPVCIGKTAEEAITFAHEEYFKKNEINNC